MKVIALLSATLSLAAAVPAVPKNGTATGARFRPLTSAIGVLTCRAACKKEC